MRFRRRLTRASRGTIRSSAPLGTEWGIVRRHEHGRGHDDDYDVRADGVVICLLIGLAGHCTSGACLLLDVAAPKQIIQTADAVPAVSIGLHQEAMLPAAGRCRK
jgi:hypothetical protein